MQAQYLRRDFEEKLHSGLDVHNTETLQLGRMTGYPLLLSNEKQMVTHAQEFGFLTDVEMITKILLIGSFI